MHGRKWQWGQDNGLINKETTTMSLALIVILFRCFLSFTTDHDDPRWSTEVHDVHDDTVVREYQWSYYAGSDPNAPEYTVLQRFSIHSRLAAEINSMQKLALRYTVSVWKKESVTNLTGPGHIHTHYSNLKLKQFASLPKTPGWHQAPIESEIL